MNSKSWYDNLFYSTVANLERVGEAKARNPVKLGKNPGHDSRFQFLFHLLELFGRHGALALAQLLQLLARTVKVGPWRRRRYLGQRQQKTKPKSENSRKRTGRRRRLLRCNQHRTRSPRSGHAARWTLRVGAPPKSRSWRTRSVSSKGRWAQSAGLGKTRHWVCVKESAEGSVSTRSYRTVNVRCSTDNNNNLIAIERQRGCDVSVWSTFRLSCLKCGSHYFWLYMSVVRKIFSFQNRISHKRASLNWSRTLEQSISLTALGIGSSQVWVASNTFL